MSEYQYYEFRAIDRRLTAVEMAKLRSFSTRARITPTSFVNDYQWGDFRGDEDAWIDKYFDVFLYFANWGTHTFTVALPTRLLEMKTADVYCCGESASVRQRNGKTILTFTSEEEPEEWEDEADTLADLIPIRGQLARGDVRSLYIGWLLCAQTGELDDDEVEPPVPPGLGDLDGSLEHLVDFLRVDMDLIEVAAAVSPPMPARTLTAGVVKEWIAGLPQAEKDDYLARFIASEEPTLATDLQRLIANRKDAAGSSVSPRTVGALLRAAEEARDERQRAEAAQAEIEKKRREREAALARSKHLEALATREPAAWSEIEALIATKLPASYDRAVVLLIDLRDVATAKGSESDFLSRLNALRTEHARRPSLISKLERAGLR